MRDLGKFERRAAADRLDEFSFTEYKNSIVRSGQVKVTMTERGVLDELGREAWEAWIGNYNWAQEIQVEGCYPNLADRSSTLTGRSCSVAKGFDGEGPSLHVRYYQNVSPSSGEYSAYHWEIMRHTLYPQTTEQLRQDMLFKIRWKLNQLTEWRAYAETCMMEGLDRIGFISSWEKLVPATEIIQIVESDGALYVTDPDVLDLPEEFFRYLSLNDIEDSRRINLDLSLQDIIDSGDKELNILDSSDQMLSVEVTLESPLVPGREEISRRAARLRDRIASNERRLRENLGKM